MGLKYFQAGATTRSIAHLELQRRSRSFTFISTLSRFGNHKKDSELPSQKVFYFPNTRSKFVLTLKAVKILVVLRVASPLIGKKQNSWTRR